MANPEMYEKQASFADDATNNKPGRGSIDARALDREFAALGEVANQTIDRLKLLQRDDGLLRDASVQLSALSRQVIGLIGQFNVRGSWLPNSHYAVGDVVDFNGSVWVCHTEHNADTVFDEPLFNRLGFSGGEDAALAAAQAGNYVRQALSYKNSAEAASEAAVTNANAASAKQAEAEVLAANAKKSETAASLNAKTAEVASTRAQAAALLAESAAGNKALTDAKTIDTADNAILTGIYVTSQGVPVDGAEYAVTAVVSGNKVYQTAHNGTDGVPYYRTVNTDNKTKTAWGNNLPLRNETVAKSDLSAANAGMGADLVHGAIKSIDTIADLKLLVGAYNGQKVDVGSYAAGMPDGGGTFVWDAASSDNDDEGTVFAVSALLTGRWKRIAGSRVTPEMFGGGVNSIAKAAVAAVALNLPLVTAAKTYVVNTEFAPPAGLVWQSHQTILQQTNTRADKAGFAPSSNTRVTGVLTVDMADAPTAWGERAHVRIDSFNNTGTPVSDVQLDTVICTGGHNNINGLCVAGGAHNIRIGRILCGDSDKIGRLFLAHWGNFVQHTYDRTEKKYKHLPGAGPTTHPHDIEIGEIAAGVLSCGAGDALAVACISAGYDIKIGKVSGTITDATSSNRALVLLTAGDLAFAYATAAERSRGMAGIDIGEIVGTTRTNGYNEIPYALYADKDETPQEAAAYNAKIGASIGRIDVTGSAGETTTVCFRSANGKGQTRVGDIISRRCTSALVTANKTTDVYVSRLAAYDSAGVAVNISGFNDEDNWPVNVQIDNLTLWGYKDLGVRNRQTKGTHINNIVVNKAGNGAVYEDDMRTGGSCGYVGSVQMLDATYALTRVIDNKNPVPQYFAFGGGFYDAGGAVTYPVSGGVVLTGSGRSRVFEIFAPAPLAGMKLVKGDRIYSVDVAQGRTIMWVCTQSGLYGSTAQVQSMMTVA